MRFGLGSYFDSLDVGEAAVPEFASTQQGHGGFSGVRAAITNPCDATQPYRPDGLRRSRC